jgi:archaetidylinositol phosphate synthase
LVLSGLSEWLSKPLTSFARNLGNMGLRPNHITLMGFTSSIVAAYGYYRYTPQGRWFPLLFLALAGFFDALDGVMARELSMKSKLGGILDSTVDRLGEATLFLGLILSGVVNAAWGLLALIFSFMVSYVRARAEGEGLSLKGKGLAERPERLIILLAATVADSLNIGAAAIAILSLITMCQRIYHLRGLGSVDAV